MRTHIHRLRDLLVHYDIDLDALFGLALQDSVQTPFWVVRGWTAKEQLWSEPPILSNTITYEKGIKMTTDITAYQDEDTILGAVEHLG